MYQVIYLREDYQQTGLVQEESHCKKESDVPKVGRGPVRCRLPRRPGCARKQRNAFVEFGPFDGERLDGRRAEELVEKVDKDGRYGRVEIMRWLHKSLDQ